MEENDFRIASMCTKVLQFRDRLEKVPIVQTGLCIVDDEHKSCPELTSDRFSDPDYNPVYSEDSQLHGGDGVLTGSAEQYR